jgi:hypothetical protein
LYKIFISADKEWNGLRKILLEGSEFIRRVGAKLKKYKSYFIEIVHIMQGNVYLSQLPFSGEKATEQTALRVRIKSLLHLAS